MERPKISINKMYITAQWRPQEKKDDYYASATKTTHPREAEYIRKDALLEWAKKELESAEITNFDEFGRGEVIAWKHVLDKLNSM